MKRQSAVLAAAAVILLALCAAATASTEAKLVKEKCRQVVLKPGLKMVQCNLTRPNTLRVLVAFDPLPVYDIQADFKCGRRAAAWDFQPSAKSRVTTRQFMVDARHNKGIYRLIHAAAKCQVFFTALAVHGVKPPFAAGIIYTQRSGATTA